MQRLFSPRGTRLLRLGPAFSHSRRPQTSRIALPIRNIKMSAEKPEAPAEAAGEEKISKGELKRRAKEAEKEKRRIEREAKEAQERAAREAANVDYATQNYGPAPMNQSQERTGIQWAKLSELGAGSVGQRVVLRARVHTSRAQGAKMVFLVLRQQTETIQALISVNKDSISKQMVRFTEKLNLESIVNVEGVVQAPLEPVKSCSVQDAEIAISKIFLVSEAPELLPFSLTNASRNEEEAERMELPTVQLDTRLNNRTLDLRTPANQAIFRISSGVCNLFREHLNAHGFVEIHSAKLQGSATESGSSVFKVEYFKGNAYLAQSPQFAKQMCIAGDMERVYEIAPVFRAENSFTHRHMTEFTGLDLEMAFNEHYHEVRDVIDSMLKAIFQGLKDKYAREIAAVQEQYPHEEFTWLPETLVLKYADATQLLRDNGVEIGELEDMSTDKEKLLGQFVKKKYNTDYYIIDKFPLEIRPFYTMPDPRDPKLSNSYDFFMRGEEILSGAQRIHDPAFLAERIRACGANPDDFKSYIDAFRLGTPPHAGGGIGLERIVMLFLKLGNIRRASLFPRDPKRLEP